MEVVFNIKKAFVYDEVAKLTAYIGSKVNVDDYDKIFTTDDDRELLERFWREACNSILDEFKHLLKRVSDPNVQTVDITEVWSIVLEMPNNYDDAATLSITSSLNSFCVNLIASKWLSIMNSELSTIYEAKAKYNGDEARRLIYKRLPPQRNRLS